MNYYELSDDINFPNRWYLGDVAFSDNWELAQQLDPDRKYEIEVCRDGSKMDYTCNEAYSISIVSEKFKKAIESASEVGFAKANIIGRTSEENFYIMSVPNEIACIDEKYQSFKSLK